MRGMECTRWLADAAREHAMRVHARAHAHANARAKPQPTDYDEVVIDKLVWLHRQVLPKCQPSNVSFTTMMAAMAARVVVAAKAAGAGWPR